MRIELLPPNEELRLKDLYAYDILDTEEEAEYNELLEVAAHICNCPMATISFIDKERQWLKSQLGFEGRQTTREQAFCAHTILGNDIMIVNDATQDERFLHNPSVTGYPSIRFYAGAPIVSQAGYNLGAVCVIDKKPRELTDEQAKLLTVLSNQISRLLELRMKNWVLKKRSEECVLLEKQLLQKTLKDHEAERSYISSELHENTAQTLAATKFYLELAEGSSETKDEWIKKSKANVTQLIKQVSSLSNTITPTTLKKFELRDILETLLADFSKETGIKTTLRFQGRDDLAPNLSMAVYRAVQEQLKNIKQHAQATEVSVIIQAFQTLIISINDNGIGIDPKTFKKGIGLNQILSRVDEFNGTLDISGLPGKGCKLTITIPQQ